MSVLNSDLLYVIFETFYTPPSLIQKRQNFRNIEFYRAMLEVRLDPPLPANSLLFNCTLVCRAWRIPAQQLMRKHLRIKTTAKFKHFLSMFENYPQDGLAVHSLDFIDWRNQGAFCLDMMRLISKCPNLRTLRMRAFNFAKAYTLPGFSFHMRHLTALDLGWGCAPTQSSLKAVLNGAPNLQVLATEGLHTRWSTNGNEDNEVLSYTNSPSCHLSAVVAYNMRYPDDFQWILSESKKSLTVFTLMNGVHFNTSHDLKSLGHFFEVHFPNINNLSINGVERLPFVKYFSKLNYLRALLTGGTFDKWNWSRIEARLQDTFNEIALPLHSLVLRLPNDGGGVCFPTIRKFIISQPVLSELQYLGFEMQADNIKYVGKARRELDKLIQLCNSRKIRFIYPEPESLSSLHLDDSD